MMRNKYKEYNRENMMKEVNDIIGELQLMLKPKIIKMKSEAKSIHITKDYITPINSYPD